jgi:hypothetical protein
MVDDDDFYVDDEPIERIREARRRQPDFVTARPAQRGVTINLTTSSKQDIWTYRESTTWSEAVCR